MQNNSVKTIILPTPKVLRQIPAYELTIDKIDISYIKDELGAKRVTAVTNGRAGTFVLWQGAEYDAIGQWTDQDVEDRIIELFS
jgi:hypothetical protein